jgi:hypothetical protein
MVELIVGVTVTSNKCRDVEYTRRAGRLHSARLQHVFAPRLFDAFS